MQCVFILECLNSFLCGLFSKQNERHIHLVRYFSLHHFYILSVLNFSSHEHVSMSFTVVFIIMPGCCVGFFMFFHLPFQAQFSQMRPVAMPPSVVPRLPIYPPSPGLGQQMFYGQAPPAMLPPQVILFLLTFASLTFLVLYIYTIYCKSS